MQNEKANESPQEETAKTEGQATPPPVKPEIRMTNLNGPPPVRPGLRRIQESQQDRPDEEI